MNTFSQVTKAVKHALLFGAASSALFATSSIANESGAEQVERIQVTGSRIKRADMETASPVTVIDSSAILATGATSIDGVLQSMTSAGGAMTNPGINNGSGGNARVNLRGLGSSRTLVLVNGRRMIASGTGAASSVDLNTIPVSMIQRIEVLKDGASAVYGTDAVAGVVNVILKRDFEGLEMNVQTGISSEGDASESSIDFTVGASNDKGNIVLGVQYTDRGDASQADRDFSNCPITETADGSELYCAGSSYAEGGHIWGDTADLSGRGGQYHDFVYSGDNNDRYNYSKDSYLSTPMQRLNLTAAGTYELSDTITFFSEAMYTKRWSDQQMAPQPIWNSESWEYDSSWMNPELLNHGIVDGELLDYGRRMTDSGTRDFSQVVDTVRIVVGLEGEFDNGYMWDVSYNKGRNDSVDTLANLHNIGSINDAVQNKTFDPFTQASWTGDSIKPFIYTELNAGGSEMDILAASLSGELFELPAGTVGFAAGIEHRLESAYYTPDSLTAQGLANDPRVEPTSGSFNVNEAYLELAVPLVDGASFAEHIELSAAMRYFDYSTFGDDNTWKLGLTWKMNDQVMLRSVASTAFRAPTVDELFGGASPSFEQVKHPATTQTQAEVTVGGNPLLTPEEADIFTLGAVIEPEIIDGLSLTVDYYDIEITNAIGSVDNNYIANLCLGADGNAINAGSAVCQSADIAMDGTGRITFNNGLQNIGGQSTAGFDINATYTFVAAGLDWRVSLDTSILDHYEESDQDGNVIEYTGFVTSGSGAYADIKSNLNVNVKSDSWEATYEARYIDGMDSLSCSDEPSSCYAPTVDSVIYHDVSAVYFLTDSITLSGGINNLLDEEPPYYSGNNDSNTDPYTYDVLGRYFFARVGVKF
ncbi:TonB-dependent receptor plug domain-containing protein [Thalassotalea atypica]|uniref:TonB-dependent receptor plug domain-containing protein n=1 Tax=Thalassotalea atypica TaxID=2054316 RepID=UPI0025728928|nr:TonB-dependent receptor [Thalassotalea atypica]